MKTNTIVIIPDVIEQASHMNVGGMQTTADFSHAGINTAMPRCTFIFIPLFPSESVRRKRRLAPTPSLLVFRGAQYR